MVEGETMENSKVFGKLDLLLSVVLCAMSTFT